VLQESRKTKHLLRVHCEGGAVACAISMEVLFGTKMLFLCLVHRLCDEESHYRESIYHFSSCFASCFFFFFFWLVGLVWFGLVWGFWFFFFVVVVVVVLFFGLVLFIYLFIFLLSLGSEDSQRA
jgi:apolipoprotein N-acyltransferase